MQETHSTAGIPTRIPDYAAVARDIQSWCIGTVFGLMSDDTALCVATRDAMGVRLFSARAERDRMYQ